MYKSYKIRLELNDKQTEMAKQHCGVARHAWNWALSICNDALNNKTKFPSAIDLHKQLVVEVKPEFPWYYDSSKFSPQQSLRNIEVAFKRCFKKTSKRPNYKKKGVKDAFYLEGNITTDGKYIKLPKFRKVKCSESFDDLKLPSTTIIKNCTISRRADKWFVSFRTEFEPIVTEKKSDVIGVDLGIKTLATLSDGMTFENRKPFRMYKRKLKLAQRQVSKKYVKGKKEQSKNYDKAALKVAKLHYKISNIRKDAIHKLTNYLTKNHSQIVIEDLNVKGMSKNRKLSSAILDCGFFEFRRQLEYKSEWYGSKVLTVNRFFPSSKTCSCCGNIKKDLTLKDRLYCCESCGLEIDRDLNAAINLKDQSTKLRAASSAASVCGEPNNCVNFIVTGSKKQKENNDPKTEMFKIV